MPFVSFMQAWYFKLPVCFMIKKLIMEYKRYTDFLKDSDFIRWQLFTDESSDLEWQSFIADNLHLENEINKAIEFLKNEGLNKSDLSVNERVELLNKIQNSVKKRKKTTLYGRIKISVVAAIAVALVVIGSTLFFTGKLTNIIESNEEVIVGELLTSEDVQLVTSSNSIMFKNDVEVKLDEEGNAEVIENNKESTKVDINKTDLNKLIIPYGKRSTVTLSDGTKVWLNSGSILEFPAQFDGNKREIRLASGEIYIDVAHDNKRPFFVHTSDFEVRVLGTSFNVSSYDNANSAIVLVKGEVSLKKPGAAESISVSPNEMVEYNAVSGSFNKQTVDASNYISWREGYLSLNKTAMNDILKTIGRYYNLSFNFDQGVDLQMRTCTGKIHLSDNLDNVLTTISLLTSTKYEIDNNRIYIKNETD